MTWAYINSLISQVPTLYDMGIYKLTPLPSKSIAAPPSIHAHIVVSPSPRSACLPAIIHISQSPLSSTSPHAATASTPSLHDNAVQTPIGRSLLYTPPPPPTNKDSSLPLQVVAAAHQSGIQVGWRWR
jgi:hypothetical protein